MKKLIGLLGIVLAANVYAAPEVSVSGVVAIEHYDIVDETEARTSNLIVGDATLSLNAKLNDVTRSKFTLYYAETPADNSSKDVQDTFYVHEAFIERAAGSMKYRAGKYAVPFAKFSTNFISDSVIYSVAEAKEGAFQASYGVGGFELGGYAYNGGHNDTMNKYKYTRDYGVFINYDTENLSFHIGHNSNGMNADVIEATAVSKNYTFTTLPGSTALSIMGNFGSAQLIAEHVAFGKFDKADTALLINGKDVALSATAVELAYSLMKGFVISVGYNATENAVKFDLPKTKTLIGFAYQIDDASTFKLENGTANAYETSDGGTGKSSSETVAQWMVAF